jgi:DNA-binding XRE family transcriptional regulator
MAWEIDFFVDERGGAPVEKYLKSLRVPCGGRKKKEMSTRWKRFYDRQMEDVNLRDLVEKELDSLQLGVQIAKLRAAENMSQTKLAARAEMSAPKISAMENEPRNLTIGTLIRVAHALDSRVEIKLVRRKKGVGRRRNGRGKVKTRSL